MSSPAPAAPRVQDANALPAGTRLGEFELRHVLGVGGFGIVYLAFDHALEREVAVKEYMPATLAGRTETMHVSLRSQSDAETFALGLRSFVNEARLLARFDHPALLKVLRFWEANGTAYMAMPVLRGQTLKEKRVAEGQAPSEPVLRALLLHLLGALERLHGEGVYHRDIAPDNIQVEPDGHPVLLDFGAARRVLSDKTQSLTAILKPAYAPIEQYAETGSVKQGPWTDFYALGATLHYVLLGKPPAPATARTVVDESSALASQGLPGFSAVFLQTVDWMLAPRPADRPQSAAELRQVLQGEKPVPAAFVVEPSGRAWDTTQILPRSAAADLAATAVMARPAHLFAEVAVPLNAAAGDQPGTASPMVAAAPAVAAAVASGAAAAAETVAVRAAQKPGSAPQAATSERAAASPQRSAWPWVAAAVAAMAVAGFVFWPNSKPLPAAGAGAASTQAAAAEGNAPGQPLVNTPAGSGPSSTPPAAAPLLVAPVAAPAAATAAPLVAESLVKPVQPVAAKPATPRATGGPAAGGTTTNTTTEALGTTPSTTTSGVVSAAPNPLAGAAPAATAAAATPGTATGPTSNAATPAAPAAAPETTSLEGAGPETKCAGRNALSYFVCMERECLRSSFAGHADCKAWRKDAKRE